MTREIKIASVQLPAFPKGETDSERKGYNFQMAEYWLDQAGQQGAGIACVGEEFNVHGIDLSYENFQEQVAGDFEAVIHRLGAVARRHRMYIIAPIYGIVSGVRRNIAMLLDRSGDYLGGYLKVHCIENERAYGVVPGDEWPTFNLDFGCMGIEICHDNSFPESARCLALNGAEVVFWPHVMGGWGGEFMDILLRAPAIHNGIYFVPACYGCDPGMAWRNGEMLLGRSSVIGPDAIIHADAGRYTGIALAKVDLDQPRVAHEFTRHGEWIWKNDMLMDRRPDTYGPLGRPKPEITPVPGSALTRSASGEVQQGHEKPLSPGESLTKPPLDKRPR
jgi:predicted amidohydrolase